MTDFDTEAVNASFLEFGKPAQYINAAGSVTASVTVVPRRPDTVFNSFGTDIHTSTSLYEVRVSELAAPEKGGKIVFGGMTYLIQAPPLYTDDERLVWLLNTCRED